MKYKDEVTHRGQNVPLHEGILIFDEVKVNSKVKWSSSGQKFFGLALTDKEFGLLYDVYEEINAEQAPLPTEYNLQFLWRDLTSDFDVVGPYFSSAVSYDHRFVIEAIGETMKLFHACNFEVVGLVCDGASTNLAAIKLLCLHRRGAFGTVSCVDADPIDKHYIKPWFPNYYKPTLTFYCCICPSHQLKNMINALYQSRANTGGTKLFKLMEDSPYFGWQDIKEMYIREENKRNAGQLRMVPALIRSHIDRDAWTKLAVFPAKIMQVCVSLNHDMKHNKIVLLTLKYWLSYSWLTHKQLEMYGCVLTDVATDALVLQHQDIRIPSVDQIFIVVDQFQTKFSF